MTQERSRKGIPERKRKGVPNKCQGAYISKDIYKFYKAKYGNVVVGLTPTKFNTIRAEFNEWLVDNLIMHSGTFYIPHMGDISIRKKKYAPKIVDGKLICDGMPIDFPRTMEYWKGNPEALDKRKVLYYTNKHSDGYKGKFYWSRVTCNIPHHRWCTFTPTRDNQRLMAVAFKDPNIPKNYMTYV